MSQQQIAEQTCCAEDKRVVGKIMNDDELFVMFYMDVTLIVDSNAERQGGGKTYKN